MTRCRSAVRIVLLGLLTGACGGVDGAVEVADEPPSVAESHVLLDSEASEAGWRIRIGGFCLTLSSVLPAEVPEAEWVAIERWDGPLHDIEFLYPPPGAVLWVRGFDASIEVIEQAADDRLALDVRDEPKLRQLAAEREVEVALTERGWELRAPNVWSALGLVGPDIDDAMANVSPVRGKSSRGSSALSSPRVTTLVEDEAH